MMGGRIALAAIAAALSAMVPMTAVASDASPTLLAANTVQAAPAPLPIAQNMPSDRVLGRADAPITIIEYASYTCSHCANFTNQVLPELKKRYIDTGMAKLIFRDLPTAPLQVSASLAALTRCSAPDKFFDVTEYLMAGQEAAFRSNDLSSWMRGAIAHSGRTEEQLVQCMSEVSVRETLNADVQAAQASGINGTPALYVNGKRVASYSLEDMIGAITPLLP